MCGVLITNMTGNEPTCYRTCSHLTVAGVTMVNICGYDIRTYSEFNKVRIKDKEKISTEIEGVYADLLKEISIEYDTSCAEILRTLVKDFLLKYKRQELEDNEDNK